MKKTSVQGPDTVVTASATIAFKTAENFCVWWPQAAYETKFGRKMPKDKFTLYKNRPGIFLGEEHGCPVGCVRFVLEDSTAISKDTILGSSHEDYGTGQAMAQWSQAAQRIGGVSVKHDAIEDCYVATVPKVPKPRILKRGETDSSSEIDWLSSAASSSFGVAGLLKTGGAGKKRK